MAWQALPDLRSGARRSPLIRDRDDGAAVARRMQVTAEILRTARRAPSRGSTPRARRPLERLLGAVALGDWASVYLAFLNGVDPTPVAEIELLKQRLGAASPA